MTAPPSAMSIKVPEALDRDSEVGAELKVMNIPLTSCPAAVGVLLSKLCRFDSATIKEFVPVVIVAEALSGPSPPEPVAVKVIVSACAVGADRIETRHRHERERSFLIIFCFLLTELNFPTNSHLSA